MTNTSELEDFLYYKCRQDPDLLLQIVVDYIDYLDDTQRYYLVDFLTNYFGDD